MSETNPIEQLPETALQIAERMAREPSLLTSRNWIRVPEAFRDIAVAIREGRVQ